MAFAAPCPTRFGTHVFCLKDVTRSKEALKAAAVDDDCETATANTRHKDTIHMVLTGGSNTTFFADSDTVLKITQPIMDSIHTIEGDRPFLSQMLPLFDELERHLERVDREGSTAVKRMKLPLLFERVRRSCGTVALPQLTNLIPSTSYRMQKVPGYHPSPN
jgi:hypothetical protein